jgi:pimeloyl-ACP methyl ester carboxylesterase
MDTNPNIKTLIDPSHPPLAYQFRDGRDDLPTLVFLHGFRSDMTGDKARFLDEVCVKRGQKFLRFDYSGHGQSGGAFEDGSIGAWLADSLSLVDKVTSGPLVLVGSSMGGWIGLLAALARPERICGFIGVAAAPDFTQWIWEREMTEEQRKECLENGEIELSTDFGPPLVLKPHFFEDGRKNSLLEKPICLSIPVTLLQGKKDADVPWQTAERITRILPAGLSEAVYIEDGDHRLSRPQDLECLESAVLRIEKRLS